MRGQAVSLSYIVNLFSKEVRALPPTDDRGRRQREERQLLALVALALILVGGGVIALIYGWTALLTALPCLFSGAGAILLLYLLLLLLEKWLKRRM